MTEVDSLMADQRRSGEDQTARCNAVESSVDDDRCHSDVHVHTRMAIFWVKLYKLVDMAGRFLSDPILSLINI